MIDLTSWSSLRLLVQIFGLYLTSLAFYRVFIHPLQRFPGPKIAAITLWYQAYYDLANDGGLLEQLEKLHLKYGPVVRIGPNELHFSNPHAYAAIYSPRSTFTKDARFYKSFGEEEASFGYVDPQKAKIRRDVMSPLFSRRAILKLEGVIQEQVDKLLNATTSYNTPVNMYMAFRSTTLDIITSYSFAESFGAVSFPSFHHPILVGMESSIEFLWNLTYVPILHRLLPHIPESLAVWLNPGTKGFLDIRAAMSTQIDKLLADPGLLDLADQEIIYHHLLAPKPEKGPLEIPSKKSLLEEALNLLFAGSDTVGNACTVGTFHVLNDERVYNSLVRELDAAWPDKDSKMGYEGLEKLPYLTAVIKESLRLSHGVVSRLPRVVGPDYAEITGIIIPAGTVVGIGSTFLHNNPDIFPDPFNFRPERWLQPTSRELENYLVSFSRGPRSCLGINLAWCEMYLIFGNMFRKTSMKIHETSKDDFKFRAYFLPLYRGNAFHAHVEARET